jgi:hypothetical protein
MTHVKGVAWPGYKRRLIKDLGVPQTRTKRGAARYRSLLRLGVGKPAPQNLPEIVGDVDGGCGDGARSWSRTTVPKTKKSARWSTAGDRLWSFLNFISAER